MEKHYDICVSMDGKHVFATSPRSARTEGEAYDLFGLIRHKFPRSEGYEISVTKWEGSGTVMDWRA